MKYRHLSQVERYQIEAGIALGMSITRIAAKIGRHRSTLFRELKRNGRITTEGYSGYAGHQSYEWRRARCKPKLKVRGRLKEEIDRCIGDKWSPEQISGRRRLDGKQTVAPETIYRYIYQDRKQGGTLWTHLRHRRTRRKKRFAYHRWPKKIPRLSADIRPSEITERTRTGHFERDIIVGAAWSGHLLNLVDRKSRLIRLRKPRSLKPAHIHKVTCSALKTLQVRSLTNDNGVEFQDHHKTSKILQVPVYFTRPYASWERGTVENTNKLIRQYFPKRMSFKEITHAKIKMVQDALNHRPRKILGFRTPLEAHFEEGP